MIHPFAVLALVSAAGWDGWWWLILRLEVAPEEVIALLLMLTFLAATRLRDLQWQRRLHSPPLFMLALWLVLYAASHSMAPPIVRSGIAVSTTLACLYLILFVSRPPAAFWGLIALAMPILPSLQFVLGYPMRVISATVTVALLQMQGHAVTQDAANLVWRGEVIQFDAPCSGVSMLRATLLLTLMGCILLRSGVLKTFAAVVLCTLLAIICNALRATSLFYVEGGVIVEASPWWHDGIGIAAFGLLAMATLVMLFKINGREAMA